MNKRYKALILLLVSLLFSPPLLKFASADSEEAILRSRSDTYNGVRTFCGKTYVYYAQNTPEWTRIGLRDVGSVGGAMCAAAALSNVIVNSVPYGELSRIRDITPAPVRIDTHNLAPDLGCATRFKFEIESECDYFRFLPLCLGNYACGNNSIGCTEPRFTGYFHHILKAYGLDYSAVRDTDLCIESIEEGAFVIVCTGSSASPIAPKAGHFFVLATVKHGYVYCIDSLCRDSYPYDRKKLIEIVEPGVFRIPVDEIPYLSLHGAMFIVWPNTENRYAPEDYDRIILETKVLKQTG